MIGRLGIVATAATVATLNAACVRVDNTKRTVLAANDRWQVIAVGDTDSVGSIFGENAQIRVEVQKEGKPYTALFLYEAGPNDSPFVVRYPQVAWIDKNLLRLSQPGPSSLPTIQFTLRNETPSTIRWLQVKADGLLLAFELQPRSLITQTLQSGGDPALSVRGEFEDGREVAQASATLYSHQRHIDVVIRQTDTSLVSK